MRTGSPLRALAAALALGAATLTSAQAMTVQPVVIDLSSTGRDSAASIMVDNSFPTPLPVEVSVQTLGFDANGVRPTGVDDGQLMVFPPTAVIQPGQRQTFRVQWVGDGAPPTSKHYYVSIAQLPVQLTEAQSAIQIVYNFQVLVNVAPQRGRAALSIASAHIAQGEQGQRPLLQVRNEGTSYAYLSRRGLRLTASDAGGHELMRRTLSPMDIQQQIGFGLIGPGQTREITLPVALPAGATRVEAVLDDAGN